MDLELFFRENPVTVVRDSNKRVGWTAVDVDGRPILSRLRKQDALREGKAFILRAAKVEDIACRFLAGEIEGRVHAVALVEKLAGVRDVWHARGLLDSAIQSATP